MNEGINLTLAVAKMATMNNEAASIAIHGVSAAYNIGQIARYRMMCANNNAPFSNGGIQVSAVLIEQYRQELIKHTILAGIDIIALFAKGISGVSKYNSQ